MRAVAPLRNTGCRAVMIGLNNMSLAIEACILKQLTERRGSMLTVGEPGGARGDRLR
jgi:hypothetical protein